MRTASKGKNTAAKAEKAGDAANAAKSKTEVVKDTKDSQSSGDPKNSGGNNQKDAKPGEVTANSGDKGGAKKVDTPHTINTGGKAPKTSEPNSIIESRRSDGSSSTTYYDDKGRAFSREDYGQQSTHGSLGRRADGRSTAHEHRFDYNERGFPVKQDVYRPLSESGSPAGPWVGK